MFAEFPYFSVLNTLSFSLGRISIEIYSPQWGNKSFKLISSFIYITRLEVMYVSEMGRRLLPVSDLSKNYEL